MNSRIFLPLVWVALAAGQMPTLPQSPIPERAASFRPMEGPPSTEAGPASGIVLLQSSTTAEPGSPNLRPFRPNGWSSPLVVSRGAGGNADDSPLTSSDPLFIDWAVVNDGDASTDETYFTTLFADGAEVGSWFVDPPHEDGFFVFVEDFRIGPLAPGTHILRLAADSRSDIAESDEGDNEFTRQIEVAQAEAPPDKVFIDFPSVKSGGGLETGIALANPTSETVELDLFLVGSDGFLAQGGGIVTNPASLSIASDGQIARTIPELFCEGQPCAVDAWATAQSENLGIAGFFLTFGPGALNIDGAEAATQGSLSLVFPQIFCGNGDFTEISLIGAGRVTLELRRADGSLAQSQQIQLPGDRLGRFSGRVEDIFSPPLPAESYILARSEDGFLIEGYETFGAEGFLAGGNAIGVNEAGRRTASILFGAQLADLEGLESEITVINPTSASAGITLSAFRTQPDAPSILAATAERALPPRAMLKGNARSLLGLPAGDFVGWLRVESDLAGVVGDITFGDPGGEYRAAVQLQRTPSRDVTASHVADGLGFLTGLTFLNPSSAETASVVVEVFDVESRNTGRGAFQLAPLEHRPRVLSEIIPGFEPQIGGFVRIQSDLEIFAFELFSRLSGGRLLSLAAVPSQRGHGVIAGQVSVPDSSASVQESRSYPASRSKGIQMDESLDFVPGEAVVKLKAGSPPGEMKRLLRSRDVRLLVEGADGLCLLRSKRIPAAAPLELHALGKASLTAMRLNTLALVESFNADSSVLYAEPNYLYRAQRLPNDEFLPLQWHYFAMKLPPAWDITVGDPDVIVAVIDSGAKFGHPDLAPRLTGGQMDFVSDPERALDGDGIDPDAEDPGSDPLGLASSYHGTHVAGTVGAVTDNGFGVAGVNWLSPLMILRVLGAGGSGTAFDITQAVLYAARLPNASGQLPDRKADVINMSLGSFGRSMALESAVVAALAQNVVVAAAAGNENTDQPSFPASFEGVISVGATDLSGGRASYSNFGPRLDVMATGGNVVEDRNGDGFIDGVLSTLWNEAADEPLFQFYEGTSMAAPHVSGIASLMLSLSGTTAASSSVSVSGTSGPNGNLTPAQVRQILQDTAIDLGVPGRDDTFGYGLADPVAALQAAGAQLPADPLLVVSNPSLDFGNSLTQMQVTVSNGGGGSLVVNPPVVELDQGAGWLAASLSSSTLIAQVSRQGLSIGEFTGRIRLTSNGGNAAVEVRMQVEAGGGADIGTVFVLALDSSTFETIGGTAAEAASGYIYRLPPVPSGGYLVVGGTDLDEDGFICDEGEFCGFYPVTNQPAIVEVLSNQVSSGINLRVERGDLAGAAAVQRNPSGLRLPRNARSVF